MAEAIGVAVVPVGHPGVCVIVQSSDGGGGGTGMRGTFVECWNEDDAGLTWIVPFKAKMKLRELRTTPGAMDIVMDNSATPVLLTINPDATEKATVTPFGPVTPTTAPGGVTNDSFFIGSIDHGTAMPWKEDLRPETYLLEHDQVMLIVPSADQRATAVETDVLIGTSGGMVASWAKGMKERVVGSRQDFGRSTAPPLMSSLLY